MNSTELVHWAHGLTLGAIPTEVQHSATRHLLDGIGNAIAARRLGYGVPGWTVAESLGGPEEAQPLTGTRALSAPAAAMSSAILVHSIDYDDTHAGGVVHPTAITLPAAFAVGQQVGATGADVLLAGVVGLETACRLGSVSPHGFHAGGLHATAVVGPLTAALVSGRLMGLTTAQLIAGLGIAGSSSSGLMEFLETDANTKSLHPGNSALNGIIAARLAQAGATGPHSVLEGKWGLYATFSRRAVDLSVITDALGSRWETANIGIKSYPSCQLMHVTLDAISAAVSAKNVDASKISDIEVHVHPDSRTFVCRDSAGVTPPVSTYDAKFDLPWSVAALLHDSAVDIGTYTEESIGRPDVMATARMVRVIDAPTDGPAVAAPGRVVVKLTDGQVLVGTVPGSRGGAAFPLTDEDLRAKFTANCGGHPLAKELADRVFGLSDESRLDGILALTANITFGTEAAVTSF
ncbi:MmgE/PrpD family protein [Rhodococcus sp. ARC_M5]|uniref:MmgE/PrpD family protein n=1 Tax=Rhodococcus sp. ARC_M5 TaxID=2928851 RepID=UPI001FB51008|nr:MmgE/PrpD family protein [Rhodococcus sp. ARC_M5]MCJ0893746.1 MmgE/PrpD family protein [Rhodococcus sp. ARC_M5]